MENTGKENNEAETKSTHKTKVDQSSVLEHLQTLFQAGSADLHFISGGESSQAFSFATSGEDFIIRVNRHSSRGYKKDKDAFLRFHSPQIPIPEIVSIGQMSNGYHFVISKKAEGDTLRHLPTEEVQKTLPSLFEVLDAIHKVDISGEKGYGKWRSDQGGENKSWREVILSVGKNIVDEKSGVSLFETTFLEKEVWDKVNNRLGTLLEYCPEERYLIHGDYGSDNVLAKEGKVTGVIDWEHSMYGDFLFDVAWLGFWKRDNNYEEVYQEFCKSINKELPNFNERILCYKLYIGLGSLSFYAYSNQKEKYESSKEKLLALLGE